jgi:3-hydroxybutyryl-CoA dehydratase
LPHRATGAGRRAEPSAAEHRGDDRKEPPVPAIDDIKPGQSASYEREVTDEVIRQFAEVSGDDNPVHLDEEFAKGTMFKGRIAHGMMAVSFISAALGTKLPGYGCIYLGQNVRFKAPVKIGDTVVTTVTVKEVNTERKRVKMETICTVGDTVVVEGDAELMVPG